MGDETMKKKNGILSLVIIGLVVILTACGPSEEKLKELETAKKQMLEIKDSAEEAYLDITDSSMENKIQELDAEVADILALDLKKFSDSKNTLLNKNTF